MREYKKVKKTYDTEEIFRCICDKCGKECVITKQDGTHDISKRTILEINPQYAGEDGHVHLDLCPECTRKLLDWFPKNEAIEDFIDTLNIWEEDE